MDKEGLYICFKNSNGEYKPLINFNGNIISNLQGGAIIDDIMNNINLKKYEEISDVKPNQDEDNKPIGGSEKNNIHPYEKYYNKQILNLKKK